MQASLYRDFLAGRRRYPAAPPGQSPHEYGWAFDLLVTPYEALIDVGETWEQWGGAWGGRWGDEIHFELTGAHEAAARRPRADINFWDRMNEQSAAQSAAIRKALDKIPWYYQVFMPLWTTLAQVGPQEVTVYRKP